MGNTTSSLMCCGSRQKQDTVIDIEELLRTEPVTSKKGEKEKEKKKQSRFAPPVAGLQMGASVALFMYHMNRPGGSWFFVLVPLMGARCVQVLTFVEPKSKRTFRVLEMGLLGVAGNVASTALLKSTIWDKYIRAAIVTGWTGLGAFQLALSIALPKLLDHVNSQQLNFNYKEIAEDEDDTPVTGNESMYMLSKIIEWASHDWQWWAAAYGFLIVQTSVSAAMPLLYSGVIGSLIGGDGLGGNADPMNPTAESIAKMTDSMTFVSVGKITLAIVALTAVGTAEGMITREARTKYNLRCQKKAVINVMRQDCEWLDKTSGGEIMTQVGALGSTTTVLTGIIPDTVQGFITLCVSFGILTHYDYRFAMLCGLAIPWELMMSSFYGDFQATFAEKMQKAQSDVATTAQEMVFNQKTVRLHGAMDSIMETFFNATDNIIKMRKRNNLLLAGVGLVTEIIPHAFQMAIFIYGAHLVKGGKITFTQMMTLSMIERQLTSSFGNLAGIYVGWAVVMGSCRRAFKVVYRTPRQLPRGGHKTDDFVPDIEFRNVTFGYSGGTGEPLLKNFSIKIKAGETVALVGPSGGGKSTCVSLMLGLYDPREGQILLGGTQVHKYDTEHLYSKHVGVVQQMPVIFSATVEANIRMGLEEEDAPLEACEAAARASLAHDFIADMDDGYNSQIKFRGKNLSGGQCQRLALARALVRKPKLLILDEATSALDAETEHIVVKNLNKEKAGRTTIIVAHRLSSIRDADRILVLAKGRCAEEGTHEELMTIENGIYARLVSRQLRGDMDLDLTDSEDDVEGDKVFGDFSQQAYKAYMARVMRECKKAVKARGNVDDMLEGEKEEFRQEFIKGKIMLFRNARAQYMAELAAKMDASNPFGDFSETAYEIYMDKCQNGFVAAQREKGIREEDINQREGEAHMQAKHILFHEAKANAEAEKEAPKVEKLVDGPKAELTPRGVVEAAAALAEIEAKAESDVESPMSPKVLDADEEDAKMEEALFGNFGLTDYNNYMHAMGDAHLARLRAKGLEKEDIDADRVNKHMHKKHLCFHAARREKNPFGDFSEEAYNMYMNAEEDFYVASLVAEGIDPQDIDKVEAHAQMKAKHEAFVDAATKAGKQRK